MSMWREDVFPDTGEVIECPDVMTKLEAARWLRLYEPACGSVMAELADGEPLVLEGPGKNWVNVGEIWERGCKGDPSEPLSEREREVWAQVARKMVFKIEYLVRRKRLRAVMVGREHRLTLRELLRFVHGDERE